MPYWSLIPAAISLYSTYKSKPRERDYKPDTSYLINKYIASLRGRKQENQVYNMNMQPYARQAGAQAARMMQNVETSAARHGHSGSGIEAQQKLSANQQLLGNLQNQHQRATDAQQRENYRTDKSIDYNTMRKEQIESQGQQYYNRAQTSWKNQMVGAAGNLAATGVMEFAGNLQSQQDAFTKAKAYGLTDAPDRTEFLKEVEGAGYKGSLANYLAAKKHEQAQSQFAQSMQFFENFEGDEITADAVKDLSPEMQQKLLLSQFNKNRATVVETAKLRDQIRGAYTPEQYSPYVPATGSEDPLEEMNQDQLLELQANLGQAAARQKAAADNAQDAPSPVLQLAQTYHAEGNRDGLRQVMKAYSSQLNKEEYNQLRAWENDLVSNIDRQTALNEKATARAVETRKQAYTYADKADEFRHRVKTLAENQNIPTDLAKAIPTNIKQLPENPAELKSKIEGFIEKIDFEKENFGNINQLIMNNFGVSLSPATAKYEMYEILSNYIDDLYTAAYPDYDPVAQILE